MYQIKYETKTKIKNLVEVEMWKGGELTSNWGESPVRQGLKWVHMGQWLLHCPCSVIHEQGSMTAPLSLCSHPWTCLTKWHCGEYINPAWLGIHLSCLPTLHLSTSPPPQNSAFAQVPKFWHVCWSNGTFLRHWKSSRL